MRWTDELATRAPQEQEQLLTLLTVGFGRLSFAVRLATHDAATVIVLRELTAARDTLARAARVLAPETGSNDTFQSLDVPPQLREVPWREFIRAAPARVALMAELETVVQRARRAGEMILGDMDAATIARHLRQTDAGLQAVCAAISASTTAEGSG